MARCSQGEHATSAALKLPSWCPVEPFFVHERGRSAKPPARAERSSPASPPFHVVDSQFPAAESSWRRSSPTCRDTCTGRHRTDRDAQAEPFARLFLCRWENGRSPPSTIKRITGFAYGFRCADPPFFLLIAAPALPFNSHQELA